MSHIELKTSMESLVQVLRELLANMQEEQQALVVQDANAFASIMYNRSPLIEKMQCHRALMVEEIDKLKEQNPHPIEIETEKDRLIHLALLAGEENVEILLLRDQILALTEQTDKQNNRNNFLLDNQLSEASLENPTEKYSHFYKPVKRRMQPKKSTQPQQKKVYVQTLEL